MRAALTIGATLLAAAANAGEEKVRFPSGAIELAGTLTVPDGKHGPFPAVVLVSGSGPSDRDEFIEGVALRPFARIAEHLGAEGIAVLRYDDRGVGESGGSYHDATLEDFAADAAAALTYLAGRSDIRADAIGILGHSEGGMVAPMVAIADPATVAFVIAIASPAIDGHAFLAEQADQLLLTAPEEAKPQIEGQRAMLDLVKGEDWSAVEAQLRAEFQAAAGDLRGTEDEYVAGGLKFLQGWLRSFVLNDPATSWRAIDVPVLALYGERDRQVDSAQNASALKAALADNAEATVVTLPGVNHLMQEAPTGAMAEYGSLPPAFADNFLPTLSNWIINRVGAP